MTGGAEALLHRHMDDALVELVALLRVAGIADLRTFPFQHTAVARSVRAVTGSAGTGLNRAVDYFLGEPAPLITVAEEAEFRSALAEHVAVVGNVRIVTLSTFALFHRWMQVFRATELGSLSRMTIETEIAGLSQQQVVVVAAVDVVAL